MDFVQIFSLAIFQLPHQAKAPKLATADPPGPAQAKASGKIAAKGKKPAKPAPKVVKFKVAKKGAKPLAAQGAPGPTPALPVMIAMGPPIALLAAMPPIPAPPPPAPAAVGALLAVGIPGLVGRGVQRKKAQDDHMVPSFIK